MNKLFKYALAAVAITTAVPTFAQGVEEEVESSTIGFTPVAVGLATPVQLPWGLNKWDIYGLDLNLFYSDAPKMYGLDIGGLATLTRNETVGAVVGGLANVAFDDVYGIRVSAGLNYTDKSVWGADIGLAGFRDELCGFDANFLGSFQNKICGVQFAGLVNIAKVESYGLNVAGIANLATTAYGAQVALGINMTKELHGAQIALVNYTEDCPSGFQVGLVNIILQNQVKVLPFVNGYF